MATELAEIKNTLEEIKEQLSDVHVSTSASEDKKQMLELSLDELRIIYERLNSSMSTTRLRTLTFLGAGLALLSYLYSGDNLFIPPEPYGRVFYFLGLGFLIAGLSFLLQAIRPNPWAVPLETRLTKMNRFGTRIELLEVLVEEYTECMMSNIAKYEKKAQLYITGFFLLLCGGILLLVIKHIGG